MNYTIFDEILLRRKHLLLIDTTTDDYIQNSHERGLVIAGLKNIQSFGYTLSQPVIRSLFGMCENEINDFYNFLIPELKNLAGADVSYNPMYPDFPRQVAEASDVELFVNAMVHYWTYGTLMPEYVKNPRMPLVDEVDFTVLSIGNMEDLMAVFSNLIASKTSLSEQDKADIEAIILNSSHYDAWLPDEIPLKENVAFVCKTIVEKTPIKAYKSVKRYFKTATDVLRLITALSNGDISLATKTKYRNLKRRERRFILDLLVECGDIVEDLFRYQYEWIRIAEILHPFEYREPKYENVVRSFDFLRNRRKPVMLPGFVQGAIKEGRMIAAADLLRARPGDFARQLDKLLRDSDIADRKVILQYFEEVVEKVSTPVLLQLMQHFKKRGISDKAPIRVFFPKGNLAKAISIPNNLPHIDLYTCMKVVALCEHSLHVQYKTRERLGKVYIDPEFDNYLIPFNQRSASKTTKTIVRGSSLELNEDAKAVRSFIWWTNTLTKRVDIDLSAAIFDENWKYVEHVSYTNLRSCKYKAYHSGDITNGGDIDGEGVAEFLDVDIDAVAKNAGRYVVYQVYSYTNQKFSDLPNCRFGWMERKNVNSGEIFEPTTVEMKMDLTANSKVAIPVIFDCVERKFIWCDMSLSTDLLNYQYNNIENNLNGVSATCYAMTHLNKPTLFDLVLANALARGDVTTNRSEADIIFSNDTTLPCEIVYELDEVTKTKKAVAKEKKVPIITAFDIDYIMGQLI